MLIHLFGSDSFRRNNRLREIVAQYISKNKESDILSLDFSEDESAWEKAREFLNQPSLFLPSKLLVIKEYGKAEFPTEKKEKEWREVLKSFIEHPKVFIILTGDESPKKAYSFLVDSPVRSQEFDELRGALLDKFLKNSAEENSITFSSASIEYLKECYLAQTERSWRIVNDFAQLSCAGFKNPIELEDVKKIIPLRRNEEVFKVCARILRAPTYHARLEALEQAFLEGADSAYIFNSLGFQARGTSAIILANFDVGVKSGKLEYEEALTSFVIGNL